MKTKKTKPLSELGQVDVVSRAIDEAYKRKAANVRGTKEGDRNARWRILEAERRLFNPDADEI